MLEVCGYGHTKTVNQHGQKYLLTGVVRHLYVSVYLVLHEFFVGT